MIIKVCVLKSLSGALLKGVGRPTAPSPGKTPSMRRLASLLICSDIARWRGPPASVSIPTPPRPVFLLPQIKHLLADNVRNYSSDLIVQMSVTTSHSLITF
jgi:hypothetical protein